MPSIVEKFTSGGGRIIHTLRRPTTPRCCVPNCTRTGSQLCDYPVGDGKTCDKPICIVHAQRVGPNKDYCPEHSKA